jgi:hypothetical protein
MNMEGPKNLGDFLRICFLIIAFGILISLF